MKQLLIFFLVLGGIAFAMNKPILNMLKKVLSRNVSLTNELGNAESDTLQLSYKDDDASLTLKGNIVFSLPQAYAHTSIGVYDATGKILERTLVKGATFNAGTNSVYWDGKNDNGASVENGPHMVGIISNNIAAHFVGGVGNNSDSIHGSTVWHGSHLAGMCFLNDTLAFVIQDITENNLPGYYFNPNHPHQKTNMLAKTTYQTNNDLFTDGKLVYVTTCQPYATNQFIYFTYAINPSTKQPYKLPNSVAIANNQLTMYAIDTTITKTDVKTPDLSHITNCGAVQKNGNRLFSGHFNHLNIYDKTNFNKLATLSFNCNKLACDNFNHLFILSDSVRKYTINPNNTLTYLFTFPNTKVPLDIDISPAGDSLMVVDGGYNNVRYYHTGNGGLSIQGVENGYFTDASVTNNKFYFSDVRGNTKAFCAYQPNGKQWIGDNGNNRYMLFNHRAYQDMIMFQPSTYFASTDPSSTNHTYLGYLRFDVDYSKERPSFKLAKNYGAKRPITNVGPFQDFERPSAYYTLANGRVYTSTTNGAAYGNGVKIFYEVLDSGFRETGTRFSGASAQMDSTGSLLRFNCSDGSCNVGTYLQILKNTRTGFDKNNNPVFSGEKFILNTPITINTAKTSQSLSSMFTDGSLLFFDNSLGNFPHLNIYKNNTLTKTSAFPTWGGYQGEFPNNGDYDIGNGNWTSGATSYVHNNVGFYNFRLEGFRNYTQGNYINLIDSSGLFLYQYGTDGSKVSEESGLGMTGNSLYFNVYEANNKTLSGEQDESFTGSYLIAQIDNFNSIHRQYQTFIKTGNIEPPVIDYIDLMTGVPTKTGWLGKKGSWTTSDSTGKTLSLTSNYLTCDLPNKSDVNITAHLAGEYAAHPFVDVALSDNVLNAYTLTGNVSFYDGFDNNINYHHPNAYIDILDNASKIIARLELTQPNGEPNDGNNAPHRFQLNGHTVWTDYSYGGILQKQFNAFSLSYNGNTLTLTSGGHSASASISDAKANAHFPKKIQIHFDSGKDADQRIIDIGNLKFYKYYKPRM